MQLQLRLLKYAIVFVSGVSLVAITSLGSMVAVLQAELNNRPMVVIPRVVSSAPVS